jgi:gliding motility-associated-like protein
MRRHFLLLLFLFLGCHTLFSQIITTFAGNGSYGFSGNGGLATSAKLATPSDVATDKWGNLYIADRDNNVIRVVNSAGIISNFAGSGAMGFSGDGGPASAAKLYFPDGIAFDNAGNLYIVDQVQTTIRKVSTDGIITTLVRNFSNPGFSGDGGPLINAQLNGIIGIAFDKADNMYISDYYNQRIRKVNAAGIITTFAGTGVAGYSGDGGPATSAQMKNPRGLAFDAADNLYVSDPGNGRVRKITTSGIISTYAGNGTYGYSGDGGAATSAQMRGTLGCAMDKAGNLYVEDEGNYAIRKISPTGIITTIAGNGTTGYSGDGGLATIGQMFDLRGICVDGAGNVYVVNRTPYQVVRKINTCATATIQQQPTDVSLCNSGSAVFSVGSANQTAYQWQLNTGSGWNNLVNDPFYSGVNGNTLSLSDANANMNGYQYRCLVLNGCGNVASTIARLTVTVPATPGITISASALSICEGGSITFSSTTTNGGSAPQYLWQKNGTNTGTNSDSYTDNTLVNGDVITCILISNSTCVNTGAASSNPVSITVNPLLSPTIVISPSVSTICAGTTVNFTSTIANGGATPVYQWKKNGITVGGNAPVYSDNSLTNGDVITCVLRSNSPCLTLTTATSNSVVMNVTPLVTPRVFISTSSPAICAGTTVKFSSVTTNSGTQPQYQWKINGNAVGGNSPTYSTSALANGDVISCTIIANESCMVTSTATSNSIVQTVFSNPRVVLDQTATICENATRQLNAGNFSSYLWNDNSTQPSLVVSGIGTYSVNVTDANGCSGSGSVSITTLLPKPHNFLPVDTSVCSYGSVQMKSLQSYSLYQWSTGERASTITIRQPGLYWLEVIGQNNCKGRDSVVVNPKTCMSGFYAPTAFTPNGDRKNDDFKPLLFGLVKKYRFTVYNRWGQVVFSTTEQMNGWDGKLSGTPQRSDVFVWTCTYQFEGESEKIEKGTITLIR